MKVVFFRWGLLALSLVWSATTLAQSITMNPSAMRIEEDGQLKLDIRIRGDGDEYEEPDLKDWRIVSSGSSSQTQIINGQFSRERIFTQVREPPRTGVLQIGKAVLYKNGKQVSVAQALEIRVEPERQLETTTVANATQLKQHAGKDVFVLPSVSRAAPFVGEPFVLSYYLYYRRGMNLSSEKVSLPTLEGFLAQDLLDGENPKVQQRVGPYRYERVTLKEELLIPIRPGDFTMGSLKMTLRSGGFFQQSRKKVASPPFTISVRAIPENEMGGPAGNVGVFELQASLDAQEGVVGQRRILTVTLRGDGNIRSISAPKLRSSPDWEIRKVEAEERQEDELNHRGMKGTATFVYMVTPKKTGTLALGPVEWVGFNPRQEKFYTVAAPELSITVTEDMESSGRNARNAGADSPLKPMASALQLDSVRRPSIPVPLDFAFAAGVPLAFLLIGLGIRRFRSRVDGSPLRQAAVQAMERLQSLEGRPDQEAVGEDLQRCIRQWIQEVSRHDPESADSQRKLLSPLLNELDQARFSGSSLSAADQRRIGESAQKIISGGGFS